MGGRCSVLAELVLEDLIQRESRLRWDQNLCDQILCIWVVFVRESVLKASDSLFGLFAIKVLTRLKWSRSLVEHRVENDAKAPNVDSLVIFDLLDDFIIITTWSRWTIGFLLH